jgi:putative peptidoglycan lipid II flippase
MFKSGLILTVGQFLSVILVFLQNVLMAKYFGAGSIADAYVLAYTLPALISSMVSAALTGGGMFLPMFAAHRARGGQEEGWEFANLAVTVLTVLLIPVTLVVVIFSQQIVTILAPGSVPGTRTVASEMLRWLSPLMILGEWAAFGGVLLNYFKRNLVFAVCSLVNSLSAVIFLFLLHRQMGIYSVVFAALLSGGLQVVISVTFLLKDGYTPRLCSVDSLRWLKEVFTLSWPTMISMGVSNISMTVDRMMASSVGVGTIAELFYAQKVLQLPIQLFPVPIMNLLFPYIVDYVAEGNETQAKAYMYKGYRLMLLPLLPSAVGLYVLGVPIVQFVFQKGAFIRSDTVVTASILQAFLGEIIFYSMGAVTSRYLMSSGKIILLSIISVCRLTLNVILNILLTRMVGAIGIPLATSISAGLSSITLLLVVEKWRLKSILKNIGSFSTKIFVASMIMGGMSYVIFYVALRGAPLLLSLLLTIAISIVVYVSVLYILRVEEMRELSLLITKKFKKSVQSEEE